MRPRKLIKWEERPNGCWEITSHSTNTKCGHATMMKDGKVTGIHRHIYEECFGEIPKGLVIRHKCDNGKCINPEHLEIGTYKDNAQDTVKRGRWKQAPKAVDKLSKQDLINIKEKYSKGNTSYTKLAKEYNVPNETIRQIIIK